MTSRPIDIDREFAIDFLQRLIRQKSYSCSDGEREAVAWMADQLRMLGLTTELVPVAGDRSNVVGRWTGTGGGTSLLFNGHLDTNPVTEGWTVDPWAGHVDEDFIYGIGVSNMKAGDAAYYCAVKSLLDRGFRPRGDVLLTYVVGELQGGVGTKALVEQGYRADYFVNSEPTDLQALTMHAASFNFVVELTGKTRHLSKREEAVDAVAAACRLVPRLNELVFEGAASDDHRRINRLHVGVIQGALGRELQDWRPAQVADFAVLRGSGRFAPGQTEDGCLADMRRVAHSVLSEIPGLDVTVRRDTQSGRISMPPFEVGPDAPIVLALNEAYRRVRGDAQPSGVITPPGFYGTDAGHLFVGGGMTGVVCGPGGRYNTMPDERVEIVDYLDAIRIYAEVIRTMCA